MTHRLSRGLWIVGTPARHVLLGLLWMYRRSLGLLIGGRCRFYPSCSAYAELAIRQSGAVRGVALGVWRVLRCSPLSRGGVDYPPAVPGRVRLGRLYDNDIHPNSLGGGTAVREGAST